MARYTFDASFEKKIVDNVRTDNSLGNLKLLCPNCHALTDNYRAKNIKKLSARQETVGVEPLKFGETLSAMIGNPEPSLSMNWLTRKV